jgi:hypothetical protein
MGECQAAAWGCWSTWKASASRPRAGRGTARATTPVAEPIHGTGMNIIANRDDMRVDLIARNFAEGFVELFRQMLKLVCQHQDKKPV